ncbi:MAG: MFS transporter [Firmicutes bacterium]|nr:MFS transporter [Bacillota bacterium]MDH7496279.1 MFS transporter [Bacillota bacterium]
MKTWEKLAYSFGALGSSVSAQAVQTYIVFFYADVLKVPIELIGYSMIAYGIWNAINDPLFGYLSDRTRTRWGRRIPYVAGGLIPLTLALIFLWMPPAAVVKDGHLSLFIYFTLMMFLFDGIYTLVILNWTALFPEMFPSLRDRAAVSMWRQVFGNLGLVVGIALAPMVYANLGWPAMGIIYGVVTALSIAISLLGSRETGPRAGEEPLNVFPALRHTVANKSFMTYVVPCMLIEFTFVLIMAIVPFYSKYALRIAEDQSSLLFGAVFLMVFVALAPWTRYTVKVGPKQAMSSAIALFAVALVPFGLARGLTMGIACGALLGLGLAGLMLLFDVLIADVIDEDEVRTGRRREGMYFGANALFIRLGVSAQALVMSQVLKASGYDPNLAAQPPSVETGVRFLTAGVPVIALVLAFLVLRMYPLHGDTLAMIKRELGSRRKDSMAGAEGGEAA